MENVMVVSNTVQVFKGEKFYFCGNYFQHKGRRLHRCVWEHYNGEIPHGYHVHHIDGNRHNNKIENLKLIKGTDHIKSHAKEARSKETVHSGMLAAIKAASKWHHSEAGKQWHSKQGKENYRKRAIKTYTCTECGKTFQTKYVYAEKSNRFCCNNCKARYGRRHRKCG